MGKCLNYMTPIEIMKIMKLNFSVECDLIKNAVLNISTKNIFGFDEKQLFFEHFTPSHLIRMVIYPL